MVMSYNGEEARDGCIKILNMLTPDQDLYYNGVEMKILNMLAAYQYLKYNGVNMKILNMLTARHA